MITATGEILYNRFGRGISQAINHWVCMHACVWKGTVICPLKGLSSNRPIFIWKLESKLNTSALLLQDMSKLEQSVVSLVELFEEYAGQDEKKTQLSPAELKQLLENELSREDFKKKFNPEQIDEVMKKLNKNHDGQINFREFCNFVSILAKGYFKQKKGKAGAEKEEEEA
ncbi:hypothetical protein AAFF_G00214800 [Aldrovandia affinis]|uniref:EF-hand domain-containing protein n=1 Tax=Aldrovandia affinis TaxID=143900 RepID=A0AAD7RGM3_9TELE|nr:hypothetical protein AAFF_G00214800 [Aldrovandia affinis]